MKRAEKQIEPRFCCDLSGKKREKFSKSWHHGDSPSKSYPILKYLIVHNIENGIFIKFSKNTEV